MGSFHVRLALAIFLVVLGLALMSWALFLAMSWHGLLLMGGGLLAGAGLLGIQVDRGEP